jgi:hypothetical protein
MKKEQLIASFQIHKAGEMTKKQRKQIASWMRQQANALLKEGDMYSIRFRAAFFWSDKY